MDICAEKLKQIRIKHSLSQELLAKQSGLSLRTIQRLESDGGGSAETMLALCAALQVMPSALQLPGNIPVASWHLKGIILRSAVFTLLLAALYGLMQLASATDITLYIDIVSLLIVLSFVTLSTLICHGYQGLHNAFTGLRYLASSRLYDSEASNQLLTIYRLQYRSCYSAAIIGSLIGLISLLHSFSQTGNSSAFYMGLHVLGISWLYAAIPAECVLRLLIHKLQHASG